MGDSEVSDDDGESIEEPPSVSLLKLSSDSLSESLPELLSGVAEAAGEVLMLELVVVLE